MSVETLYNSTQQQQQQETTAATTSLLSPPSSPPHSSSYYSTMREENRLKSKKLEINDENYSNDKNQNMNFRNEDDFRKALEASGLMRAYKNSLKSLAEHPLDSFLSSEGIDEIKLYKFVAEKIQNYKSC